MDVKDTEYLLAPPSNKATRIKLFSLGKPHMRTFHLTWFAFFLAFFGWFGIAPMMALVRDDLGLTKTQIGNTIIASVAITILARLLIGWLCDRIGPRLAYSGLLVLGSIPVMCIGLAQNYETFLLFRLAIGVIGASFVITQYHTSVMFAPNVVGTANATTAGWGNMGGGVTQMVMPPAPDPGADAGRGRDLWLAGGDGDSRRGPLFHRIRLLLPDPGLSGGKLPADAGRRENGTHFSDERVLHGCR